VVTGGEGGVHATGDVGGLGVGIGHKGLDHEVGVQEQEGVLREFVQLEPALAAVGWGGGPVWLRYCYGIGPVLLRCISHVDAINMGDTPVQYRRCTVAIP
jgi:hypothetical protein